MVLRCTAKLLKLVGPYVLVEAFPPAGSDWYANLFWVDRRKCILLTHSETLFSVLVADVRADELRPPSRIVTDHLPPALESEQLNAACLGVERSDLIRFARTANRSVLGYMNDITQVLPRRVAMAGGLGDCDIARLNHDIRRTIFGPLGPDYPIERAKALAGT